MWIPGNGHPKLHCDQPQRSPSSPARSAGQALAAPQTQPLPTEPAGSTAPQHPGAQGDSGTAQRHKAQGQHRGARGLAESPGSSWIVFHYCQGKAVLGGADCSNQLISTQFRVVQAYCSNSNTCTGHLNTDLQALVRCLRSQQLHCELPESITLKLRNLHGGSVA